MKIFTYIATDPECPVQAIARIWMGKSGWHPLLIGSINEASARQRAEDFWNAELAKAKATEEKKAAKALKRGGAPPLVPAPEPEPIQAAAGVVDVGDVV